MKSLVGWLERLSPLRMALTLALVAELMFLVHLGQPARLMLDEVYDVPAGKDIFGMVHRSRSGLRRQAPAALQASENPITHLVCRERSA